MRNDIVAHVVGAGVVAVRAAVFKQVVSYLYPIGSRYVDGAVAGIAEGVADDLHILVHAGLVLIVGVDIVCAEHRDRAAVLASLDDRALLKYVVLDEV